MKTVIEMAKEAGFPFNKYGLLAADESGEIDADEMLERFAALVLQNHSGESADMVQEPVAWREFNEWMHKELPSGSVIGDPGWWASKIYRSFIEHTTPPTAALPIPGETK